MLPLPYLRRDPMSEEDEIKSNEFGCFEDPYYVNKQLTYMRKHNTVDDCFWRIASHIGIFDEKEIGDDLILSDEQSHILVKYLDKMEYPVKDLLYVLCLENVN